MRELDLIRIRDLVGQINLAPQRLDELAALPEKEFLSDFRNTESAKYLLLVANESAIDICKHIVSRRGARAPQDYADCFTVLTELGAVSPDLAEHLRRMAHFRNLLVHLYSKVADQRICVMLIRAFKSGKFLLSRFCFTWSHENRFKIINCCIPINPCRTKSFFATVS